MSLFGPKRWGVREIWPPVVVMGKKLGGSSRWLTDDDNEVAEYSRREYAEASAEAHRKHATSVTVRYEVRPIRRRLRLCWEIVP
jgi:hypothetical protein